MIDQCDLRKATIWSNINIDEDAWVSDYKDFLEINEIDGNPEDQIELQNWISETLEDDLHYERDRVDIQTPCGIIQIADLGLWNGRKCGYREISSGNIKDCLYCMDDFVEWYIDENDDLVSKGIHHDGTNYYLYRAYKDGITDAEKMFLKDLILSGKVTMDDINACTDPIGDKFL